MPLTNAENSRRCHHKLKIEVLSHYGPLGQLCCSWENCVVNDPDMLTLDHINNDGAVQRRKLGNNAAVYRFVRKEGYPAGFQTLCHNHQWKKEIVRRRECAQVED